MVDSIECKAEVNKGSEEFSSRLSDLFLYNGGEDEDVIRAVPVFPKARLNLGDPAVHFGPDGQACRQ